MRLYGALQCSSFLLAACQLIDINLQLRDRITFFAWCIVTQCDSVDHGLPINAVVTATQYLNTPGGPLNYSLEGHPFAPFGLGVTSDGRYLVTASGVFIIWDLGTGDVFHRVTPPTSGGLVRHLAVTPDNKRAVAFTSNNEVLFEMFILILRKGSYFNNVTGGPSQLQRSRHFPFLPYPTPTYLTLTIEITAIRIPVVGRVP